jgi:ribosomal protein S18 acetylase RimI-like enzyme
MKIRPFRIDDEASVIELWNACGLTRPWNDPKKDIARKLTEQADLFLVGEVGSRIVATAMFGFDGTRGWVHYLGVLPSERGLGHGRRIMEEGERLLLQRGCPKVNLQVRVTNEAIVAFYKKLGYGVEEIVSMGKRLIPD